MEKKLLKKRYIYLGSAILLLSLAVICTALEIGISSNPVFFNHLPEISIFFFKSGTIVSLVGTFLGLKKFLQLREEK